jgi:hypothetical protein
MKKAQSISIDTIIVAAIALVVLVLVVMIFTSNITKFRRSADACESNRGFCINADSIKEKCSGDYFSVRGEYKCYNLKGEEDKTKVCCLST